MEEQVTGIPSLRVGAIRETGLQTDTAVVEVISII